MNGADTTDPRAAAISAAVIKLGQLQTDGAIPIAAAITILIELYDAAYIRGVQFADRVPVVRDER